MAQGYCYDFETDGSSVFLTSPSTIVQQSAATVRAAQAFSSADRIGTTEWGQSTLAIIFPEPRTLVSAMLSGSAYDAGLITIDGSNDTTDGKNGTWTVLASNVPVVGRDTLPTPANTRTAYAISGTWNAIRFNGSSYFNVATFQVFDTTPPAGLVFWDATLSQLAQPSVFDFGDVAPFSVQTIKQFRIKNNSSTLTANQITIAADTTSDYGAIDTAIKFDSGSGFSSTVMIGDLAPGATSSVIDMRRDVPATGYIEIASITARPNTWT